LGGKIVALLVAALSGVAMAFQGSLNTALGKRAGLLEAVLVVHVLGSLILAALIFVVRAGDGNLANLLQAPWYLWLGGPLSVVIVYTVVASINRVGVSFATTAIIIGQVLAALIIDHLGLWGLTRTELNWWKLPGLILFALGAKLLLTRGS
jgi:transporter family-2 protein